MKKNYLLLLGVFSSAISFAQNPSAQITRWKNDAKAAYTIIHDDYGMSGVDGIWQYGDTIAANRGIKFGFGAIANECESNRIVRGKTLYNHAKQVMMDEHGHELINHSFDHGCAVGRAGWDPCTGQLGWGESTSLTAFNRELNDAHTAFLNGTGYAPVYYIFPYDRHSDLANQRLKDLGYSGSRSGWPQSTPLIGSFPRNGYNNDDPHDYLPDADGYFRNAVQVFDDNHRLLNSAGQLAVLNGTVNNAITNGTFTLRELHNVGDFGWGAVRVSAYRDHMNYVKSKIESGELYNGTVTQINSYQLQKVKYQPQTSYNANTKTINVTWTSINPQITVNVANYINGLVYKDPITLKVNLDGLNVNGDWDVSQNGNTISNYSIKNGFMLVNVYPHQGPVQIKVVDENTNFAPTVVNAISDQNLTMNFASYTIDLKTVFNDDKTSVSNLVYSATGNTNILISISNGVATISSTNNFTGTETITFTATDEGNLTASDVVSFTVTDPFANRTPFLGQAHPIPGRIEAEDFDNGPEGVTYNEEFNPWEPDPSVNPYRLNHPVDIQEYNYQKYSVDYTVAGEWLEYTVNAPVGGNFNLVFNVAQVDLSDPVGRIRLTLNGYELMPATPMTFTDSWTSYKEVTYSSNVTVPQGTHILRLEIVVGNVNVDYLEFLNTTTNTDDVNENPIVLFPNPARDYVNVEGIYSVAEVYNASGRLVKQFTGRTNYVGDLASGVYFVKFPNSNKVQRLIISR